MADEATRQYIENLSPRDLAQLQALANKRNETLEMVAAEIRRQKEAQQSIINKMR